MSRLGTLRLALRIVRGNGRVGALRAAVVGVAMAISVAAVLVVAFIPAIASHRADVRAARAVRPVGVSQDDTFEAQAIDASFGDRPLRRILIAGSSGSPRPPGADAVPRAGEVVASPALQALLASEPRIRAIVPGQVIASVRPDGLTDPDELFAYIGVDGADLEAPASGFGGSADAPVDSTSFLVVQLALFVLIPAGALLVVASTLSSRSRGRRWDAMRAVSVPEPVIGWVAAIETLIATVVGGAVGLVAFALLRPTLTDRGLGGLRWFAADLRLTPRTAVATLVLVGIAGVVLGRRSARRSSPASRREPTVMHRWGWRSLPLAAGCACLLSMVGLRLSGRVVHAAPLFLAAALLATTGLALQLVPLVRSAGQVVARRSHRLAWRLGGHRASHEPRSVVRILAGLVALVVVGHVTFAVLADLRLALGGGLERVVASVAIDEAASSRLDALLGVRPDAALMTLSEDRGPAGSAMVAYLSCQTIERIDQVGPCRPGSSFRVGTDGLPTDVPAGASYRLATRSGASTVVVAPSAEIDDGFHLLDSTTIAIAGRLPSDPPAGTEVRYLVDRSDLASLEAEVAEIDPALIVQSQIDAEKLAAYDQHVAVARFGALAGVLLATSCFVVASVDRLLERRSHLATLVAIGVPRWVLRESQVAQLVVPMATALAMANGVGWLVAQGYLAIGGLASGIAWRSLADGLAISAAAMVVASSAALLISVPSDLVTHLREE